MPRTGRKTTKQQGRRKGRRLRQVRRKRASLANSEFASAKQTVLLENDQVNQVYQLDNVNLSQFDRMCQIAEAYQYYRITKIEMKFKPFSDTYLPGANSIPVFMWLIDRAENFNLLLNDFQVLRSAGAKPIRFDEKHVNIAWKPTVLQTIPNDSANPPFTNTFSVSKLSPWLPTNRLAGGSAPGAPWQASVVPHRGIYYGVQQDLVAAAYQYGVEITVHMQFKKPNVERPAPGEGAQPAVPKVIAPRTE